MASKKMSPLKMQLAACCVLVLIATVAGAGCLSNDGGPPVCCQGRNNTCVRPGARVNDEQSRLCYCDDECLLTGDCCLDYKDVCQRKCYYFFSICIQRIKQDKLMQIFETCYKRLTESNLKQLIHQLLQSRNYVIWQCIKILNRNAARHNY